jgi:hypothetical protein
MPIVGCPDCDHHFRVGDLNPGATVTCTNCGAKMAMPDRPLRKRTRVAGAVGGRSDYIDAEDFVAGTKVRRKKDKLAIILSNAFTVALIVGTTGLTILVLIGGGLVLTRGFGRPAAPATGVPVADAPAPAPVAPAAVDPPADAPAMEPDWQRLLGVWEQATPPADGRPTRMRIEFTADRRMVVSGHEVAADGTFGAEVLGARTEGRITGVANDGGAIVVRYTSPVLADGTGKSRFRFGDAGDLVRLTDAGEQVYRRAR